MIRNLAIALALLVPFGVGAALVSNADATGTRCRVEVYDDGYAAAVCLGKVLDPRPIREWSIVHLHATPPYDAFCVALEPGTPICVVR